jgi:glucose-6-phosphate 1-epimerase
MNNSAQLVRSTLPSSVRAETDSGRLPHLSVRTDTAEADVYFQGAQVTAWRPASSPDPVLWMSGQSRLEPGQAIRGGIPICFPWFSKHQTDRSAPPHGFARTRDWTLELARHTADGAVVLEMELAGERITPHWPHRFRARHRITVGADLRLDLEVMNTGRDAFTFEEALHAYFDVADIREVTVSGPGPEPIRFDGLTNRVYPGTREGCIIRDPVRRRDIVVSKSGSNSTVVWNPWAERAREISDMSDDGWIGMVCVEPSNVGADARTLAPGDSHTMSVTIETRGW